MLKTKDVENQRNAKAMEETIGVLSERFRKTAKENHIVRERTLLKYEQNKKEIRSKALATGCLFSSLLYLFSRPFKFSSELSLVLLVCYTFFDCGHGCRNSFLPSPMIIFDGSIRTIFQGSDRVIEMIRQELVEKEKGFQEEQAVEFCRFRKYQRP
ncbi:hypothetical protein MKW92_035721 [Papaver armeniacum]|nr:hypothetical protein MKW92_035721 [Papaver armeniacum]